ncbi:MAG: hypothetical protein M3R61_12675 [Chloroflexota bacterium]|nr:hypothetical protein [Chloroflexota bacterium]
MVKIPLSYPLGVRSWPPEPSCAPIVVEVELIVTLCSTSWVLSDRLLERPVYGLIAGGSPNHMLAGLNKAVPLHCDIAKWYNRLGLNPRYVKEFTMFTCLPPSNDNEWLNLREFVHQYNIEFSTHYNFLSSPELEDSSSPQPEVILQDGENFMVIERKIFPSEVILQDGENFMVIERKIFPL